MSAPEAAPAVCTRCGRPVTETRIAADQSIDGRARLIIRCSRCGVLTRLVPDSRDQGTRSA